MPPTCCQVPSGSTPSFDSKKKTHPCGRVFFLVEVGRVELPSESISTAASPGADGPLHSLVRAGAVTLGDLVASLCMARSKLCALTFTTRRRSAPGPWYSRGERSLIKQREELYRCCSLIYKRSPILRMVGASARYSCLRAPVETVTPPRQPNTMRSCGRACAAASTAGVRLPLRLRPAMLGSESVKNEKQ